MINTKNQNTPLPPSMVSQENSLSEIDWLASADFKRVGSDLLLEGPNGEELVLVGYFNSAIPMDLIGKGNVTIPGYIVKTLAGSQAPAQYAQTNEVSFGEPIGYADTLNGNVNVVRSNGLQLNLEQGDPIFQGDTLETGEDGLIGITFSDDSTLSLDQNGRMVIDEMVYDPATQDGSGSIFVLQGTLSFISGQLAKANPDAMSLSTTIATVGIRGTSVLLSSNPVENNDGVPQVSVIMLPEAGLNGETFIGEAIITTQAGSQVINNGFQGSTISSATQIPSVPQTVSLNEIANVFGSVVASNPNQNSVPQGLSRAVEKVVAHQEATEKAEEAQAKAGEIQAKADEIKAEAKALDAAAEQAITEAEFLEQQAANAETEAEQLALIAAAESKAAEVERLAFEKEALVLEIQDVAIELQAAQQDAIFAEQNVVQAEQEAKEAVTIYATDIGNTDILNDSNLTGNNTNTQIEATKEAAKPEDTTAENGNQGSEDVILNDAPVETEAFLAEPVEILPPVIQDEIIIAPIEAKEERTETPKDEPVNHAPTLSSGWAIGYDFENLISGQAISGQDGWESYISNSGANSYAVVGETVTLGDYTGSIAYVPNTYGGRAVQISNTNTTGAFDFGSISNDTILTLEVDLTTAWWGHALQFGTDINNDGDIIEDAGELSVGLHYARSDGDIARVYDADATLTSVGHTFSDINAWVRYRITIDTSAYNGEGSISMSYRELYDGATWTEFTGLQDVNAHFDFTATDASNPNNWDGIYHKSGNGGVYMDNISITNVSQNYDLSGDVNKTIYLDSITVADQDGDTLNVTLSVSNGTISLGDVSGLSFIAGNGTSNASMNFSGSANAINAALRDISYDPQTGFVGFDTFTLQVSDGRGGVDSQTTELTIGCPNDPMILDLDGDGVELLSSEGGVDFDIDGDDDLETIGWVSPDDGLLVADINQDGVINDFSEVISPYFTEGAETSLEALAHHDSNNDGLITNQDDIFETLLVWQDQNSNGQSEEGELSSLLDLGISSIDLGYLEVQETLADNSITKTGSFTYMDGHKSDWAEVVFAQQAYTSTSETNDMGIGPVPIK